MPCAPVLSRLLRPLRDPIAIAVPTEKHRWHGGYVERDERRLSSADAVAEELRRPADHELVQEDGEQGEDEQRVQAAAATRRVPSRRASCI